MWLVAGSSGQLGRCMARLLQQRHIDFFPVNHEQMDISNIESVTQVLRKIKPSVVINAAAWTAVDDTDANEDKAHSVNALGPANLAKISQEIGARLIHISTDYVFSGTSKVPYSTTSPTEPINKYGETKLLGDQAVMEIGNGEFPIIRTAWLYSEFGKNFAKTMAVRALKQQSVSVVNDQFGQPTSANDLAEFIFNVAHLQEYPSVLHGTNSGHATWFEFAQEIYSLLEADISLVLPVATNDYPNKVARPIYSILDHSDLPLYGITPMRNWKDSLLHVINDIQVEVQKELLL